MQDQTLDLPHTISINNGDAIEISHDEYVSIRHLTYPKEGRDRYCNLLKAKCDLPDLACRDVVNIIAGSSTPHEGFHYLDNRSVSIDQLVNSGNLYDAFDFLDPELIDRLYHYQYYSQPVIGNGEILVTTLLQHAKKSNTKGDCIINGHEVEVKCDGGRIRGQSGYGDGHAVSRYWSKVLDGVISEDSQEWNWIKGTKKRTGWAIYHEGIKYVKNGMMSIQELRGFIKTGLKQAYLELNDEDLKWIDEYVHVDTIDKEAMRRALASTLIKYYLRIEDISGGILVLSREGKVARCTMEEADNYWEHGMKIKSYPSWLKKAGCQGQTIALAV